MSKGWLLYSFLFFGLGPHLTVLRPQGSLTGVPAMKPRLENTMVGFTGTSWLSPNSHSEKQSRRGISGDGGVGVGCECRFVLIPPSKASPSARTENVPQESLRHSGWVCICVCGGVGGGSLLWDVLFHKLLCYHVSPHNRHHTFSFLNSSPLSFSFIFMCVFSYLGNTWQHSGLAPGFKLRNHSWR